MLLSERVMWGVHLARLCQCTGMHAASCHLHNFVLWEARGGFRHIPFALGYPTLPILIASPSVSLACD